jgi:hypothetical protein
MLFGYPIESDFDPAKEQRRTRLGWILVGGTVLCVVYLFSGRSYAVEVFQAFVATGLSYGAGFYVDRRNDLSKLWVWKVVFASVPLHVAYLAVLFWSDKAFPSVMTKAVVFIPVLAVAFGIESILIDRMADGFKPSSAEQVASVPLK